MKELFQFNPYPAIFLFLLLMGGCVQKDAVRIVGLEKPQPSIFSKGEK